MAKRRAAKLKVPKGDETRSGSGVKREYLDEKSGFSSFMDSSCSRKIEQQRNSSASYYDRSELGEKPRSETLGSVGTIKTLSSSKEFGYEDDSELKGETVGKKTEKSGFKCRKRASLLSSDRSSDEDSELEEKLPLGTDRLMKAERTEGVNEAGLRCEESPDEDTDSDDDGWPTLLQGERDVGSKKKADETVDESDKESDEEWREDEWKRQREPTEDEIEGIISQGDISQAKFVLRNITSRIPLVEETAIRRGVKLSGPPLEFATTHLDEYARKFRWPQHVRNLRNTNFSQDPTEILEDFELLTATKHSDPELPLLKQTERDLSQDSAFAQVPRPMVALAAGALRRSSRKRKRTTGENASSGFFSAPTLLNIARVGRQFGDHFIESLLSANGKALQGIDSELSSDIDKRCWSSLPTKRKPIANCRFVLEHVRRIMGRSTRSSDAVYPPMKQETLERITNRLKILHGCTTQHEENDIFEGGTLTTSEMNECSRGHSGG